MSSSLFWRLEVGDQGAAWPGEGLFQGTDLSPHPHGTEGQGTLGVSFIRVLIPHMRAPPS